MFSVEPPSNGGLWPGKPSNFRKKGGSAAVECKNLIANVRKRKELEMRGIRDLSDSMGHGHYILCE
jgi:hypothetical protein